MKSTEFIIHNGQFISKADFAVSLTNRAFRYGDGVFETMFASAGEIHFFADHFTRFSNALIALKMTIPNRFIFNTASFKDEILSLIRKNKNFTGAKIRFTAFRKGAGLYTPETDEIEYVVETESLNRNSYILNQTGLKLGDYRDIPKDRTLISEFKNSSALLYVLAGRYCKVNKFDDCLLFNSKENIAEAISSNVFYVKNGELFTPPVSEGCVDGVMRKQIIRLATENNIPVNDDPITEKDFYGADEVFLTNAVSGIRWVISYKDRRFYNKTSVKMTELLNLSFQKPKV